MFVQMDNAKQGQRHSEHYNGRVLYGFQYFIKARLELRLGKSNCKEVAKGLGLYIYVCALIAQ